LLLSISSPAFVDNLTDQQLLRVIIELIQQDPRLAYKTEQKQQVFGMKIFALNVRFSVKDQSALVTSVVIDKE